MRAEHLPAGHLGKVDQAPPALPEFGRGLIEGTDRPAHFVMLIRLEAGFEVPACELEQAGGQFLNRPADPIGEKNDTGQGQGPDHRRQQDKGTNQVLLLHFGNPIAGLLDLFPHFLQPDAQVFGVEADPLSVASHVVEAIPVWFRDHEPVFIPAIPELA